MKSSIHIWTPSYTDSLRTPSDTSRLPPDPLCNDYSNVRTPSGLPAPVYSYKNPVSPKPPEFSSDAELEEITSSVPVALKK